MENIEKTARGVRESARKLTLRAIVLILTIWDLSSHCIGCRLPYNSWRSESPIKETKPIQIANPMKGYNGQEQPQPN